MHQPSEPEFIEFMIAFAISAISATVSITRRILSGHNSNWLWVISEFMTAILCGYLMFNAYPFVHGYLPNWVTEPVAVAFVAHSGGRIFQELESVILKHYGIFTNSKDK